MASNLIRKNIVVNAHRTSLGLEREFWVALEEICRREGVTLNQLCEKIEANRGANNRTSDVRRFVIAYFRRAAGETNNAGGINVEKILGGIPEDRPPVNQDPV